MTASLYIPFFFFNDTATTEIYTLSLHDALPISLSSTQLDGPAPCLPDAAPRAGTARRRRDSAEDRKSTRLNSSHQIISYAVFCLKKKKLDVSKTVGDILSYRSNLVHRSVPHAAH